MSLYKPLPFIFAVLLFTTPLLAREGENLDPEVSRELLAHHTTIAQFDGIIHRPCLLLTAQCPNECNHSKTFATFTILSYLQHEAPSEYGKEKETTFAFALDGESAVKDSLILATLKELTPGDTVKLAWNHDYITTQGGSRYPQRPVLLLEKVVRSLEELAPPTAVSAQPTKEPSQRNKRVRK